MKKDWDFLDRWGNTELGYLHTTVLLKRFNLSIIV